jgi:hypothetical protein
MRRVLFLVLATPLAVSTFSSAQAGSLTDLRADEQRLRRQELQLDQDRDRLVLTGAHMSRAGRFGLTSADQARPTENQTTQSRHQKRQASPAELSCKILEAGSVQKTKATRPNLVAVVF